MSSSTTSRSTLSLSPSSSTRTAPAASGKKVYDYKIGRLASSYLYSLDGRQIRNENVVPAEQGVADSPLGMTLDRQLLSYGLFRLHAEHS